MKYHGANFIDYNIISQIYDEVYSVTLINSIVYYNINNSAADKNDNYVVTRILKL